MEDLTKEQLLQEIKELQSAKGICPESDRMADEQISLLEEALSYIKEGR